jgi:hypothetical protein|tara:strand:- start:10718 stop:11635 length:918 start_codon:yes stop_codon:yes gene_type:complete
MSQVKLTSIERVISGIYRDLKPVVELNENDMIEWAGEALEHIGAYPQLEEKVANLTVSDHRVLVPSGLKDIVQIAYKYTEGTSTSTAMLTTADNCITCDDPCGETACRSCATVCEDAGTLIANAQLFLEYYKPNTFRATGYYYDNYRPLRKASGPFTAPYTSDCTDCTGISPTCEDEYRLDWPYIKTSFKQGHVCIAYVGQPLDERGFPMIPDEVSYIEAIKRYITYKVKYSEFLQGHLPGNIYMKLEDDWHWYCKQARNKMTMPKSVDDLQNLKDQHIRLLPKPNRYHRFFGHLHSAENLNLGN